MKFINKHKKFISRVLAVTVSLMLLLSSLSVSASSNSVGTAGLETTEMWFNVAEYNGVESDIYAKGFRWTFDNSYGINAEQNFRLYLKNPVVISSSTYLKKVIQFIVDVPSALNDTFLDEFKVSFMTDLGNDFSLKCDYKVVDYAVIPNTLFGSITRYSFYIDSDRLGAMFNYVGDFRITGVHVFVSSNYSVYLGANNYISIGNFLDCKRQTIIDESAKMIAEALQPVLSALGGFLVDSISYLLNTFVVPAIDALGFILTDIFDNLKPLLTTLFDDLFFPVLEAIRDSVVTLNVKIADALYPLFADIVNYFTPYFNQYIDIITQDFIDLRNGLAPILNQFIEDITPSFNSIVENMSKNIRLIVEECFIPDNSSEQFQEFVALKEDITNKIPIFEQFSTFLSALFNSDSYSSSSSLFVERTIYLGTISGRTSNAFKGDFYLPQGRYIRVSFDIENFDLVTGNFTFTMRSKYPLVQHFILTGDKLKEKGNVITFYVDSFEEYSYTEFVRPFGDPKINITNLKVCILSNKVSSGTVATYRGQKINALNMDWYKPYKKYGDILIISFCYLTFIWRTFRRLPSMI